MGSDFLEELKTLKRKGHNTNGDPNWIEEADNVVVQPVKKETINKHEHIIANLLLQEMWARAMATELRRTTQDFGNIKGTDIVCFLTVTSYI